MPLLSVVVPRSFLKTFTLPRGNSDWWSLIVIVCVWLSPISKKEMYGFIPDYFKSTQSSYGDITKGKVYTLSSDINGDGKINYSEFRVII